MTSGDLERLTDIVALPPALTIVRVLIVYLVGYLVYRT